MNSPAAPPEPSASAFAEAVSWCGLLSVQRVAAIRADLRPAAEVANELVEAGELTEFQAEKLLKGQWHGLLMGRFAILAPLGRGGMGIVYLAREAGPSETKGARPLFALKILPPRKAEAEPRTKARFLREMQFGPHVPDHPHIARVFEADHAGGVNYIAMEFVPGDTLRTVVNEGGPLSVPDAARIFAQVAAALAAAHEAGLIHRDLKPSNIMVTPAGTAKVLDFGFAIHLREVLPDDPALIGGPGYALGTVDYMSPEQAVDGTLVTPATDIYALGCSLYFTLTGSPPFPGGTPIQKIRWHKSETPPSIRSINPNVPAEFVALIERMMAKKPADRFETAAEVRRVLNRWANDGPGAMPVARPSVRRKEEIELTSDDLWEPEDTIDPASRQSARTASEVFRRSHRSPDQTKLFLLVGGLSLLAVLGLAVAAGVLFRLLMR